MTRARASGLASALVWAVALAAAAPGCALTSRGAVLHVRYFSPEPPPNETAGRAVAQASSPMAPSPRPALRLGRVRGAPYLRERIARRESSYELGFYDDREWTERPEAFVRRALARTLFEDRGFERVTGAGAPELDVDVLAFEEVRTPALHAARVSLRCLLENDTAVLDERTVTVDRPVAGERFDDFVAAMSEALADAAGRVADLVATRVPRAASSP